MVMVTKATFSVDAPLSLKEAAVLSGFTEKAIRHELAGKVVRASRARGRHRRFGPRDVLYFLVLRELPVELDKEDRRGLFVLLSLNKEKSGRWRRDAHHLVLEGGIPILLQTDDVFRQAEERVGLFLRGRDRVVSSPHVLGGELVFRGTRISVRFVGERARKGESVTTLLEDYPSLTKEDIEFARIHVALGRPPGRPKKRPRFVRGAE